MKRLMIGQFNKYNEEKQQRDFRGDFFGVEVCQMESEEDIEIIDSISKKDEFTLGIHFPLRTGQWRLRDPQYLSKNVDVQDESFDYMEREFKYSMKITPYYI
jgi:hypothetical protein